jgi:hypothetical protein
MALAGREAVLREILCRPECSAPSTLLSLRSLELARTFLPQDLCTYRTWSSLPLTLGTTSSSSSFSSQLQCCSLSQGSLPGHPEQEVPPPRRDGPLCRGGRRQCLEGSCLVIYAGFPGQEQTCPACTVLCSTNTCEQGMGESPPGLCAP